MCILAHLFARELYWFFPIWNPWSQLSVVVTHSNTFLSILAWKLNQPPNPNHSLSTVICCILNGNFDTIRCMYARTLIHTYIHTGTSLLWPLLLSCCLFFALISNCNFRANWAWIWFQALKWSLGSSQIVANSYPRNQGFFTAGDSLSLLLALLFMILCTSLWQFY